MTRADHQNGHQTPATHKERATKDKESKKKRDQGAFDMSLSALLLHIDPLHLIFFFSFFYHTHGIMAGGPLPPTGCALCKMMVYIFFSFSLLLLRRPYLNDGALITRQAMTHAPLLSGPPIQSSDCPITAKTKERQFFLGINRHRMGMK